MINTRKSLLLCIVQLLIVLSLAGKLLYDRATRPRVWVLAQVYDPELPIRGRYLAELLRMPAEGFIPNEVGEGAVPWYANRNWAYLQVRNDQLIATAQGTGPGAWIHLQKNNDGSIAAVTEDPVLFFISEQAKIPSLKPGEEMWVEVTVPAKGPPRPIRIGVKKNGALSPFDIH